VSEANAGAGPTGRGQALREPASERTHTASMRRWVVGLLLVAVLGYAVAATVAFVFSPQDSDGPPPSPVTVTKTITLERP
jgi:hypothetical protein